LPVRIVLARSRELARMASVRTPQVHHLGSDRGSASFASEHDNPSRHPRSSLSDGHVVALRANSMLAVLLLREAESIAVRIDHAELKIAPGLVQDLSDSRHARFHEFSSELGCVLDVDLDVPGTWRPIPCERGEYEPGAVSHHAHVAGIQL